MRRLVALISFFALFSVGCAPTAPAETANTTSTSSSSEAALTQEGETPTPVVTPAEEAMTPAVDRYADALESTKAIASLLMARHTEDLPTAETLAGHADAEAALRWLASDGDPLVQRVRALSTLRFFSGVETRTLLLEVLSDAEAHPTLHAGAVAGTGGFDLALDDALRGAVEAASAGGDPRVERAVVERLR